MNPLPESSNESSRLASLHSHRILDTSPDAGFEDIVDAARRLLRAPIALVTLVDSDRQWFKARRGINLTETSRESSFCTHAILGDEPMVVPDTLLDSRFRDNPQVTGDPKVRFYLGVPIITQTKERVGTVCVLDNVPRSVPLSDIKIMKFLGRQTDRLLELHMLRIERSECLANRRG